MSIPAYPLQWPGGWERSHPTQKMHGRFKSKSSGYRGYGETKRWESGTDLSIADAVKRVREELGRMGIGDDDIVISTNLELRLDGYPRSGQREPEDVGAAVYWRDRGQSRCMAIDRYYRVADNIGAIAATLEAMRAIERHGGATILDRAFTGFTALAPPGPPWHDVLGVSPTAREDEVLAAYRRLRAEHHPDRAGGNTDRFVEVQHAYETYQAERSKS
jgi:hypothetical protein